MKEVDALDGIMGRVAGACLLGSPPISASDMSYFCAGCRQGRDPFSDFE